MVLVIDAIWDSATIEVVLIAGFYTLKLRSTFRGGKLEKAYNYYLLASAVLLSVMSVSLFLDVAEVRPVETFSVSLRDLGLIASIMFLAAGLRKLTQFWDASRIEKAGVE